MADIDIGLQHALIYQQNPSSLLDARTIFGPALGICISLSSRKTPINSIQCGWLCYDCYHENHMIQIHR